MKEFKKGDILVGIIDDEKYIFTYDCIVNIKIQSQFVKSSIVAKNIINSMGDICSPFLFQIDSVKKADDNTVLAYKNALDKYGKDEEIWNKICIKPMDFVMPVNDTSNIGLVTETNGVGGSCSVTWLKNPNSLCSAWWPQEDLKKVNNLANLLTKVCAHPFGNNQDVADEIY